jgi:EmrB/QacA subfamily drug resistance transporter
LAHRVSANDSTAAARRHPTRTLAILAVAALAYSLLQSSVAPALPTFQRQLHTSESGATWVLTGYLLSASVATPVLGRLGDMLGKHRVLMWTLAILAVGTLISAVASSIGVMIAGRVIQGAGGGVFPLAFGIVRDEFPREKVAEGIGLLSAILGIGAGLGVVLCGVIVENLDLHWLFWIPFAVIVVSAVLAGRFVPESPVRVPGKIDWTGAALMTLGLSAVLLAVSETTTWGWGSARTLGLIAAGLAVLAVWVAVEIRRAAPLVDMRMMRLPGVWTTNLSALLLGGGMYISFILIPTFVQLPRSTGFGFGASVLGAGIYLLPSTMMMLIFGTMAGRISGRFGSKAALVVGTVFAATCFVLLAVDHAQPWCFYVATGLLGIGVGLAFAALGNLIVEAVPPHQTGVATGMNTVARTLGGALGGQVAVTFVAADTARGGMPGVHGFEVSFVMAAVILVVGVIASLRIPARGARDRDAGTKASAAGAQVALTRAD